jgi:predicted RND superfamily exporter protein
MNFFFLILIGFGSGIIIFPIGLLIYNTIKNAKERRAIKRMIKNNQFLIPIDTRDYDVKAWQNQKYGNINPEDYKQDLENLNLKIFKKDKDKTFKDKIYNDFISKIVNYLIEARKKGFTDEQLIEEFKKKNYSDEIINQVFFIGELEK